MRCSVLLLVLVDVTLASAEPVHVGESEFERQQREEREYSDALRDALNANTAGEYRGGGVQIAMTAGVRADSTMPGSVDGSVNASWDLPMCRILGGHARGQTATDREVAWAIGGTVCIPLPVNLLQITYTRGENVRRSLLQGPVVLTDRRAEHSLAFDVRVWRWRDAAQTVVIAPVAISANGSGSLDERDFGDTTMKFDIAPVEWRRHRRALADGDTVVRFLPVAIVDQLDGALLGNRSTSVLKFGPVSIEDHRVVEDVAISLDGGLAAGSAYLMDEPLLERVTAYLDVAAAVAVSPVTAELRFRRDLVPTYGGQLVLENRTSAAVALPATDRKLSGRVEGFVAKARIERRGPNDARAIYGGGVDATYALLSRLHAYGRFEAARSLVPGLETDPLRTQWDVRATLGIATHFDQRW